METRYKLSLGFMIVALYRDIEQSFHTISSESPRQEKCSINKQPGSAAEYQTWALQIIFPADFTLLSDLVHVSE